MNKLIHASKLKTEKIARPPEPDMEDVSDNFINGKLKDAILLASKSGKYGVNVAIPNEGYRKLELFNSLCVKKLTQLGYQACVSHDGAGMYNTIGVGWE